MCPTSSMGGWCSCSIALEPGCSKFRGELTSWSSSVEPVGVQLFPTWAAFPFIVQGGAPLYMYLALWLGTVGYPSSLSVVGAHSVSREWGGLILVGFLGQRVVQALSHPWLVGTSWSLGQALGDQLQSYPPGSMSIIRRATLRLSRVAPVRRTARPVRVALPRPDRGCPVTPAGVMEWRARATIITAREGTSVDALSHSVAGTARAALSLCQGAL